MLSLLLLGSLHTLQKSLHCFCSSETYSKSFWLSINILVVPLMPLYVNSTLTSLLTFTFSLSFPDHLHDSELEPLYWSSLFPFTPPGLLGAHNFHFIYLVFSRILHLYNFLFWLVKFISSFYLLLQILLPIYITLWGKNLIFNLVLLLFRLL